MNFYDILLARCLCCNSGGEDGGESSDLSTASVTLDVTNNVSANDFFILSPESVFIPEGVLESGTYNCILAYGKAEVTFTTGAPITTYSGDVQIGESEEDGGLYHTTVIITGDCSITLVGSQIT